MARHSVLLVALIGAALALGTPADMDHDIPAASAQVPADSTPQPRPGKPDDLYWYIAHRGPFADQRVRMVLARLVDERAVMRAARGQPGAELHYYEVGLDSPAPISVTEARAILAAAGYADASGGVALHTQRTCRLLVPSMGSSARQIEDQKNAAPALATSIAEALSSIGVPSQPCVLADDADFALWGFGGTPHVDAPVLVPMEGFLTWSGSPRAPRAGFGIVDSGTISTNTASWVGTFAGLALAALVVLIVLLARRPQ